MAHKRVYAPPHTLVWWGGAHCGQIRCGLVIEGFLNELIVAAIVEHIKDGHTK